MTGPGPGLGSLRRFVTTAPVPAPNGQPATIPVERCDLCGEQLGADHRHLVDTEQRRILCACRPCTLLFDHPNAGRRLRAVPDRVLADGTDGPSPADWEALQLPVGTAFFLRDGGSGQVTAFYPSPAGATQSLLDLADWARIEQSCPVAGQARPDVEAVLAHRDGGRVECFVVPIDRCYQLVGTLRRLWRGFDGGQEAPAALAAFLAALRRDGVPFPAPAPLRAGDG
jgi:hypothetical protein